MNKIRKVLLTVLSVLTLASLSLGVASCELIQPNPPITDNSSSQTTDNEFRQVYAMYVTYAESQGEPPLSYEMWLASILGEKGDKGDNSVDIEKAEFDKDGNLVITFTDGTLQTIEMPKQETHVHTFGEWTALIEETGCDNKLFFRICSECKSIEWEQRVNSRHDWKAEYSYDDSYHWIACNNCDKVKDKAEHTLDNAGKCTVCKQTIATPGVNYKVSEDGTYAEVVSYTGNAIEVVIADTYKGLPVTNIQEFAFIETKIASIIIPDSVTSIGVGAFQDCDNLTGVYITNIATWCNISLEGPDSNPLYYARKLYLNDELVTELTIPDSVTEIKSWAFYDCSSLTSVTIPSSVTLIGGEAFHGCGSLTSITMGDGVTSIGLYAFAYCDSLVFQEYGNCQYLGNEKNPYLALIQAKNQNYSSYTIHEDTKVIVSYAFDNCSRMGSIVIPNNVTSIGEAAFICCTGLKSVYITDMTAWCSISFDDSCANPLYNAKKLYLNNELVTELIIPDSVTEIKSYVFSGCNSLTSVTIGDSVTSIGEFAFFECFSLTNITIPDGVTSIENSAFCSCSSLTSVTIGNSVTSIGENVFSSCGSLMNVTIGDSVTSIGAYAFFCCHSLTSVYYKGTESDWNKISIGNGNSNLTNATRYYSDETSSSD